MVARNHFNRVSRRFLLTLLLALGVAFPLALHAEPPPPSAESPAEETAPEVSYQLVHPEDEAHSLLPKTCRVCHRESEEVLRANVYERQDKNMAARLRAEDLLVRAHVEDLPGLHHQ